MKVTHYRPIFPDLGTWPTKSEVPARFQRLFEDYFGKLPAMEAFAWSPAVDIVDGDGELVLTAELPGLTKEDVQLTVDDGVLTLKGEKKEAKTEKTPEYRLVERSYGSFERTFTLPRIVDTARVKAQFKDGLLKVHLPKAPNADAKKVEISDK